jgi:chromosome segregation ATPase
MGITGMDEDHSQSFKIHLDDDVDETADEPVEEKEIPEEPSKKEIMERRADRSGRKLNLTVALLICLITVGLAGVYLRLKNQIAANTNAGATAVTSLSISLESRLGSIADAQTALDKKLADGIGDMDKRIDRIGKSIETLKTSKPEKAEVEKAIGALEKNLGPLQKKMDDLKSKITVSDEAIQKKIVGLSQSLTAITERIEKADAQLSAMKDEISRLQSEKLGKTALKESLKSENEKFSILINNLNRELGVLKLRTKALEESQNRADRSIPESQPQTRGKITEQPIR